MIKMIKGFGKTEYVDTAENVMKEFSKKGFKVGRDKLTTTQIRNILSLTGIIYDMTRNYGVTDEVINKLLYLRVQLVYTAGRNLAVKEFVNLSHLLDILTELQKKNYPKDSVIRLCRYMEAMVAYFKFYGGKD